MVRPPVRLPTPCGAAPVGCRCVTGQLAFCARNVRGRPVRESKLQILSTCFTSPVNTADDRAYDEVQRGPVRMTSEALAYWITKGAGRRTVHPPTVGSTV